MIVFLALFLVSLAVAGGVPLLDEAHRQRAVDRRLARKYGWTTR